MSKANFAGLVGSKARADLNNPSLAIDANAITGEEASAPPGQSAPKRPRGGRLPIQANRVGKQPLSAWFDVATKKQFEILAVEEGKSNQDLLTEAVNLLFKKYNKPPTA